MRNLHLEKTLELLGHDSADLLNSMIEQGAEVAYEVLGPGDGSPLCQYEPLSAQFVRDNGADLQRLESFRVASDAIGQTALASPYLEEMGIDVPAHPERRSDLAILAFLCRLWDNSAEFILDDATFNSAYEELEACGEPASGEAEVVVPLFGLQMELSRIDVGPVAIVRADTVDVPAEARRGEGSGRAAWEPVFLATAKIDLEESRQAEDKGTRDPVSETFNQLVTTLRLFKEGSIGIGPHAWVSVGNERWRRVATGAARPRAGSYRLTDEEVVGLADFARAIARRPSRIQALERAIARFEAGLERRSVLDSLNDHLLSLRFLLDGEGSAGFGFAMRVAAISVDTADRADAKASIEGSLALERQLWSGEPAADSTAAPAQLARDIEDMARGILKRSVAGELPTDLRATADEILLGTGAAADPTGGPGGDSRDQDDSDPISSAAHELGTSGRSPQGAPVGSAPSMPPQAIASQPTQELPIGYHLPNTGALLAGAGSGSAPSDTASVDVPDPAGSEELDQLEQALPGAREESASSPADLFPQMEAPQLEAPQVEAPQIEAPLAPEDLPQVAEVDASLSEPISFSVPEMELDLPEFSADSAETRAMDAIQPESSDSDRSVPQDVGQITIEEEIRALEDESESASEEEHSVNPPAWLDEVGAPTTSEWPVGSRQLRAEAESEAPSKDISKRVSFLFPRPETTEWSINEPQGRLGAARSA